MSARQTPGAPGDVFVSLSQARKLARAFGVKVPRVGYEVALSDNAGAIIYLASTGHAQFGWFESKARQPYRVWGYFRTMDGARAGVLPALAKARVRVRAAS